MSAKNQTTGLTLKKSRGERCCRNLAALLSSFLLAFVFASIFTPVETSGALTCTDGSVTDPGSTSASVGDICDTAGTSVTVNIDNPYFITVSSSAGSSGVNLDYTAASSPNLGSLITSSDTVTTTSNTGQPQQLYISTTSSASTIQSNRLINANTDLSNNKTYLSAGGGDTLTGATALSDNTWGFNIENNNNFTKVPTLGNDILLNEEVGTEDTTSGTYVTTSSITYGAIATSDLYAGEYSNTIKYTAITYEPPVIATYMQDFTTRMCNSLKVSTATEDHRITLKDRRDEKEYKVSRLADGNCWMVQNLALDGGRTLHPSDSNVTEDRTLNPNIENGTTMTSDRDYIFSGVANNYTSSCGQDICVKSTEPYGNHYNWKAATAIVGNSSQANTVYESVCPSAGNGETWRLPDHGSTPGVKTYHNLASAYISNFQPGYNNGLAVQTFQKPPLYFTLAGWYGSSANHQGILADYWSRTSGDKHVAYHLYFFVGDGGVFDNRLANKSEGCSIRCVLGE